MATHFSILTWRILWTEEFGGLRKAPKAANGVIGETWLSYTFSGNKQTEKRITHNCPQEEKIGEAKGRSSNAHFKKE